MSIKQKKRKPLPGSYRRRDYRLRSGTTGLCAFEVMVGETDLQIMAPRDLATEATDLVRQYRNQLENYISRYPEFLRSLTPLAVDRLAPPLVQQMMRAALAAGVGPMAAVAGTISEFVGQALLEACGIDEVVVENGGDIFMQRATDCTIAIFAGSSPLSQKVGVRIAGARMPLGVCTSSATVGHSLSLGRADAVTVLAASTALADAAATRLGNEVKGDGALPGALALAGRINGVEGVVIIKDEQLGAWGDVELVELG